MSYALETDETVDAGLRRCAGERLERAAAALEDDLATDPENAVHTARKSLKQTRSLLRLAVGALPKKVRRRENQTLAELGRSLSGARDADVLAATLEALGTHQPVIPARQRTALRRALGNGRVAEDGTGDAAQVAAALRAAQSRVREWPLRGKGFDAVEAGLTRAYRRGRTAMRSAESHPDTEHLHEWRKRVKDHWYHLRLLAEVSGPAIAGQAQDASRLADLLGEDHDLGVLAERLDALTTAPAGLPEIRARLCDRRTALQAEAFALGARVYAERPKDQRRRMRRAWRAGRKLAARPA